VPSDAPDRSLTVDELASAAAVPVRTVRYYIAEGLLPSPGARGKNASYTTDHLLRLRLIRLLTGQRVPLAEIRERLASLSAYDVRSLLASETRHQADLSEAASAPSPKAYLSTLLNRARSHKVGPQRSLSLTTSVSAPPSPSVADLLPPPATPAPAAAPARTQAPFVAEPQGASPAAPPSSLPWHRHTLAPGVELHVRADATHLHRPLVERLLSLAASLTSGHRR